MSFTGLTASEFEQIRGRYDPVATRSHSINTRCYTDPRFLQIEQEQIFRRSWQFLCHEEKLREAGSYITRTIGGQPVLALKNRDGELRAFYNVCRHRGHELMSGEGQTRRITCPYHAWTYDLDGALVNAPRSEYLENFDAREICLAGVQIETFCHLVFINLDPKAPSLATQSDGLAGEVMQYAPDLAQLTFSTRLTYRIRANWKAIVDNFLECYHCPVAHKGFSSMIDMDTYKVETHGIYSSHMAKARVGENSAYDIADATCTDHAVWFLWPNMTLMRYPGRGNFMLWRFYPVSAEETWEEFDFFFETAQPDQTEREALKFIDEVLQPEDIGLVESVQRGMNTPAFDSGRYMVDIEGSGASEHAVHHFHGLILDAYRRAERARRVSGVLDGKTAFVTGGTGGIGNAICARFAREGARVIAADISPQQIPADGVEFIEYDVTSEPDCTSTFAQLATRWNSLDILVNAAGIEIEKTIEETTLEEWNRIFAINVTGMFLTSKYALPLLRKSSGASVINFGSYDGYIADPGLAAYCATKGAVHALTRAMACDHGPEGIRVNAICPGYVDTPMLQSFFGESGDIETLKQAVRNVHPIRRYGQPDDIANLVNWLASDEARYASGQLWVIDGGLSAQVQQMKL